MFQRGEKVEAKFRGGRKYFTGKISRSNGDGTYAIDYEDGDRETHVDESLIRSLEDSGNGRRSTSPSKNSRRSSSPKRGGGESSKAGIISSLLESNVDMPRFRKSFKLYDKNKDGTINARDFGRMLTGYKVKFDPGQLREALELFGDGKNSITYEKLLDALDGNDDSRGGGGKGNESEDDAPRSKKSSNDQDDLTSMLSDVLNSSKLSDSSISKLQDNLEMLDMDASGHVPENKFLQLVDRARFDIPLGDLKRITKQITDDKGVKYGSFIKVLNSILQGGGRKARSGSSERNRSPSRGGSSTIEVGSQVEALFRGGKRYYKGEIAKANRDGTYAISYQDGDYESSVPFESIRVLDAPPSSSKRDTVEYKKGDRVEVQILGSKRYVPGYILRVRGDRYDIKLDSGDTSTQVSPDRIRPLDEGGASNTDHDSSNFNRGDRVEAKFKGGSKFYKGKITRVNSDGTFDIEYDDGDSERRVDAAKIRSLEERRTASPKKSMAMDSESEAATHNKGDRVEARFRGGSKYYKGTITRVNVNGSYDISYDDGDSERGVDASKVRSLEERRSGSPKKSTAMDSESETPALNRGDRVEARFRGGSKYFKGKITRVNVNGTYDIAYDDGDSERGVDASKVRSLEERPSSSPKKSMAMDSESEAPALNRGDRVEARFRGGSKYFKGKITRVNVNGTYDISYDDGDNERGVDASKVRSLEERRSSSPKKSMAMDSESEAPALNRGDRVEARFRGGSKYFKGKITRVNVNGTYDIAYDDGDSERGVDASKVRSLEERPSSSPKKSMAMDSESEAPALNRGDRVEARFRGGSKYFKGKITRVNVNGTYDISYDDGDNERGVDASKVRSLEERRSSSPKKSMAAMDSESEAPALNRGDRVEARFRGGSKYFKGKITRVNANGTYDIAYDDGDSERGVDASKVRSLEERRSSSPKKSLAMDSESEAPALNRGDRVEARFRGGSKYFKGKITRVNMNGTYDIAYDDGDNERGVDASKVRSLDDRKSSSPKKSMTMDSESEAPALNRGDRVEARFRGGSKYYKGKITRVNMNGTFDITYDDGDSERGVDASKVRSLETRSSSPNKSSAMESESEAPTLNRGDRVEAKFRGGLRYYKGKITRVNANGTYDITYDDGDSERGVDASKVRSLEERRSSSPKKSNKMESESEGPSLNRGDRVEARFRGGSRYYKGKITRVNANGTYDITYDDGDSERGVDASKVRSLNQSTKRRSTSRNQSESESEASSKFREGDSVEARLGGGRKYYPGKIAKVHADGSVDISYKNGDRERRVSPNLVRSDGLVSETSEDDRSFSKRRSSKERGFRAGDEVEAKFRGGRKYYKGKIKKVHSDGSCDIQYADGDFESKVLPENIQSLDNSRDDEMSGATTEDNDDLDEILRRVISSSVKSRALRNFEHAFNLFDRNGDGIISKTEFSRALDKLGITFSTTELNQLMRKLDRDRSGNVDYKEFRKMLEGDSKSRPFKSPARSSSRSPPRNTSRGVRRSKERFSSSESESDKPPPRRNQRDRPKANSKRTRRDDRNKNRSDESSDAQQWSDESLTDWELDSRDEDSPVEDGEMDRFMVYLGSAISKDKRQRYKAAFEKYDESGKGTINPKNLNDVLSRININKRVSSQLQKNLVKKFGNSSNKIKYRELVKHAKTEAEAAGAGGDSIDPFSDRIEPVLRKIQAKREPLSSLFAKLDKTNDGTLPKSKLVSAIMKVLDMSRKSDKQLIKELVDNFDDGNDEVNFNDMLYVCTQQTGDGNQNSWQRATAGVNILNGIKHLKEDRERRAKEGVDPLVWQVMTKLRQTVSDTINSGYATDYASVFELFDYDRDGIISEDEMSASLAKLGFDLNGHEVQEVMKKLDPIRGGNGVDYKHFLMFLSRGSDREKWVLGANGQALGNTISGELENEVRAKIREVSMVKNTGRNTILKLFKSHDKSSRGFVQKKALKAIATKLQWNLTEEELLCIVSRFDTSGGDQFNYSLFLNFIQLDDDTVFYLEQRVREFVSSMLARGVSMKDCFGMFTRSASGKLGAKELSATLIKIGHPANIEEAQELVRRHDIDRDNKISLAEFSRAFGPEHSQSNTASQALVSRQHNENLSYAGNQLVAQPQLWTDEIIEFNGAMPVGPKGSVGEWLENVASQAERRNFFSLLNLLSNFEKRLGLQQAGTSNSEGEFVIQLGTKLKAQIKFVI